MQSSLYVQNQLPFFFLMNNNFIREQTIQNNKLPS